MAKRNFIITVALMLLIVASTSFADVDKYQWKFDSTENGCQVYTSAVAGKEYIAAKTTCIVPAGMDLIGWVLRDIASYPEWMPDCKETKILKVVNDQDDVFIFWLRQHIPILKDRDLVLKSHVFSSGKGQDFIYADLTDEVSYDSGKGYVRMPSFHSLWILEWIDREHTKVTFMIDPNLGKGLSAGIANYEIKKTPYKAIHKMMKMVTESKYINGAKTSKYNAAIEKAIKDGILK